MARLLISRPGRLGGGAMWAGRTFAALALGFCVGVAWRPLPWPFALALFAGLLALSARLSRSGQPGALLCLLFAPVWLGAAHAEYRCHLPEEPLLEEGLEVVATGTLLRRSSQSGDLAVSRWQTPQLGEIAAAPALIGLSGLPPEAEAGVLLRVRGRLRAARGPSNPGEADLGARDEAVGRRFRLAVATPFDVAILGPPSPLRSWAREWRTRHLETAEWAVAEPAARHLLSAIAVGAREGLGQEWEDRFSRSGLAHILSVSGLHLVVVGSLAARLARLLLRRRRSWALRGIPLRIGALLSIPAIWAYVVLTGASLPAVRSGWLLTLLALGQALERPLDPWNGLAFTAALALIVEPASLHDLSFQLTFAAMAGLALWSRPLRDLIPIPFARFDSGRAHHLLELLLGTLTATLAATFATAPLLASAFHRLSLAGLLTNVLALPLSAAMTGLAALSAALIPLPPLCGFVLVLAEWPTSLLLNLADWGAAMPGSHWNVPAPTPLFWLAWASMGWALLHPGRWPVRAALLSTALALRGPLWTQIHRSQRLEVTFLSIGQGDATFIRLPDGFTLLIDGGGQVGSRWDPARAVLFPFLAESGVQRLDAIALTHPHPDHALGLIALGPLMESGELWLSAAASAGGLTEALVNAHPHARSRSLCRGARFEHGNSSIEVLGPPCEAPFEKVNDQSLVLMLRHGSHSILLMGDAESAAERELLTSGLGLHAEVVKVGHHGSATSSTPAFVEAVGASHAVFSVGRDNRFHFPRPEVVERWERVGAHPWRTDLDGAIQLVSEGDSLTLTPFLSAEARPSPDSPAQTRN